MCEYEDGGGADDVAAAEQQQYQEGGDPMAPPGDLAISMSYVYHPPMRLAALARGARGPSRGGISAGDVVLRAASADEVEEEEEEEEETLIRGGREENQLCFSTPASAARKINNAFNSPRPPPPTAAATADERCGRRSRTHQRVLCEHEVSSLRHHRRGINEAYESDASPYKPRP